MDVSRNRQRENMRGRGQEIRVSRGTEADRVGQEIKADSPSAAPECNHEASPAREHLGRVQGSTSHASLELEKRLQAKAQTGILFLNPQVGSTCPSLLPNAICTFQVFRKNRHHHLEPRSFFQLSFCQP